MVRKGRGSLALAKSLEDAAIEPPQRPLQVSPSAEPDSTAQKGRGGPATTATLKRHNPFQHACWKTLWELQLQVCFEMHHFLM